MKTYKSVNLVSLESDDGNAPVNPFDDRTLNKHDLLMSRLENNMLRGNRSRYIVIPISSQRSSEELQFF